MGKALLANGLNGTQFMKTGNTPNANGKVYTYEPNTTTPTTTFTDQALTVPHTNPIILDENGRPPSNAIWLSGEIKLTVKDEDEVELYAIDDVNAPQVGESLTGWGSKDATVLTKTGAYTVTIADDGRHITCNSASDFTITLPAAATAGDGFVISFYNGNVGTVTIDADGSEQIDASTTFSLRPIYGVTLRCDGTKWWSQPQEKLTTYFNFDNFAAVGVASGDNSATIQGTASGDNSLALGSGSVASAKGSIALGTDVEASNPGEFAFGSDDADSSKRSEFVVKRTTTDATPSALHVGGTTSLHLVIPANTVWGFQALVVAREPATGNCGIYEIAGAIKRDGSNNTSLVGSVTVRTIAEDAGASAWAATAVADDTNEALQIQVTGEASHTINWVGHITTVVYGA